MAGGVAMVEQVVGLVSAVVPAVVRAVKEGRTMGKASRDKETLPWKRSLLA